MDIITFSLFERSFLSIKNMYAYIDLLSSPWSGQGYQRVVGLAEPPGEIHVQDGSKQETGRIQQPRIAGPF